MHISFKSLTILNVAGTLFIACATTIFFYSCQKNPEIEPVDCSGPAKSFAVDVNPIIRSTCATDSDCHGAGSASGPGPLLNYTQSFNSQQAIRSALLSGTMPKDGHLSVTERNAIICWIDNGALNN